MPAEGHLLPLSSMDRAISAQTYPGRPMTTHHGLEFSGPLQPDRLRAALLHLVGQSDALRSTFQRGSRATTALSDRMLDASLEIGRGRAADVGWLDRGLNLAEEWPFRVRMGTLDGGLQELVLTLHHGLTDGHGALRYFDWLLRACVADEGPPSPFIVTRRRPVTAMFWARLLGNMARYSPRLIAHRGALVERPGAAAEGFGLDVTDIAPAQWAVLKGAATRLGCTRNTLVWCAALRAGQRFRRALGASELSLRFAGGVDLRRFFGTENDPRNWIGTLEAEFTPHEIDGPQLERLVDERLQRARQPERALVSPVLMQTMVTLGGNLSRAIFRRTDEGDRPFMYSLALSHIRPTADVFTWPDALKPVRLWCASTVPRKPGLSMTLTTIDDRVTLATCWVRPMLEREGAQRLVRMVLEELNAYVTG